MKNNANKKSNKNYLSSFQLLERVIVYSDEQLLDLANLLKDERPILCSFELLDVAIANKMIGFLSGVVYAMDGITSLTDEKTILFAPSSTLEDGTLQQFIKERKN